MKNAMDGRDTIYKGFDYILSFDHVKRKFFIGDNVLSSNIRDVEYNEKDGVLIIYKFEAENDDRKVICIPVSSVGYAEGDDASRREAETKKINDAISAANKCISELNRVLEQTNNNTKDIKAIKERIEK